jgi:LysR family hca operon transcriptional activator
MHVSCFSQAEAAVQSARQIAYPTKPTFSLGFMIGHDTTWLPGALRLIRDDLPNIHVVISTQNSPQLAAALLHGGIDVAFLRREDGSPDLAFRTLVEEPFAVFLPSGHPLAAKSAISLQEIANETFISVSGTALSISGNSLRYAGRSTDSCMRTASKSGQAMKSTTWVG